MIARGLEGRILRLGGDQIFFAEGSLLVGHFAQSLQLPVGLGDLVHNDVVVFNEADVLVVAKQVHATSLSLVEETLIVVVALLQDHVVRVYVAARAGNVCVAHVATLILAVRRKTAVIAVVRD